VEGAIEARSQRLPGSAPPLGLRLLLRRPSSGRLPCAATGQGAGTGQWATEGSHPSPWPASRGRQVAGTGKPHTCPPPPPVPLSPDSRASRSHQRDGGDHVAEQLLRGEAHHHADPPHRRQQGTKVEAWVLWEWGGGGSNVKVCVCVCGGGGGLMQRRESKGTGRRSGGDMGTTATCSRSVGGGWSEPDRKGRCLQQGCAGGRRRASRRPGQRVGKHAPKAPSVKAVATSRMRKVSTPLSGRSRVTIVSLLADLRAQAGGEEQRRRWEGCASCR
jgi:hypothetical protein